ncbi:MAG: hypothetical protein IPP06_09370 [Saprospiraceae bacterium]|nr:hypothetical protein [Candidatus Vicinibacter affinis]
MAFQRKNDIPPIPNNPINLSSANSSPNNKPKSEFRQNPVICLNHDFWDAWD